MIQVHVLERVWEFESPPGQVMVINAPSDLSGGEGIMLRNTMRKALLVLVVAALFCSVSGCKRFKTETGGTKSVAPRPDETPTYTFTLDPNTPGDKGAH